MTAKRRALADCRKAVGHTQEQLAALRCAVGVAAGKRGTGANRYSHGTVRGHGHCQSS